MRDVEINMDKVESKTELKIKKLLNSRNREYVQPYSTMKDKSVNSFKFNSQLISPRINVLKEGD